MFYVVIFWMLKILPLLQKNGMKMVPLGGQINRIEKAVSSREVPGDKWEKLMFKY